MRSKRWVGFLILGAAISVSAGCGKGAAATATVKGKVTYKGEPVTGGTVTFFPEGDKSPVPGQISADGTFSFGGVPVGPNKITVVPLPAPAPGTGVAGTMAKDAAAKQQESLNKYQDMLREKGKLPGSVGGRPMTLPQKYADPKTTDLTWDLKPGVQEKEIVLSD